MAQRRTKWWRLWFREVFYCQGGLEYLVRRRIIQTPLFSVYLHDIKQPDGDRDPHNHPWSFVSIILRGGYVEAVHRYPVACRNVDEIKYRRRGSVHRMSMNDAHRITHAEPGLKTLIVTGPWRQVWGFHTPKGWVPWDEYVTERDVR